MKMLSLCLLFFLSFGILFYVQADNDPVRFSDFKLEQRDGLWYKAGSDIPYSGMYIQKSIIGNQLGREAEYRNGELVQEKEYSSPAGRLQLHRVTKEWGRDKAGNRYTRDYTEYSSYGNVERQISYEGPKGMEKVYYIKSKALCSEKELYEGVQHGKYTEYYTNGKVKQKSNWENGKMKDITEWNYYNDGTTLREVITRNGPTTSNLSSGEYKRYFFDGALHEEGQWGPDRESFGKTYSESGLLIEERSGNGNPNADYRYYFEDTGTLREEYSRREGREVQRKTYYKNGNLRTSYKDNVEKSYNTDGQLMSEMTYDEDNNMCENAKSYHENGQLMSVLNYKDNRLEGTQVRYNNRGEIMAKMNFKAGKVTDKTTETYHPDGSLQSRIEYDGQGNVLAGEVFYPDGKLFVERKMKEKDETLINVNIYPDNEIYAQTHNHSDNTIQLSYIIFGEDDAISYINQEYFEAGRFYPVDESESFADCGCGPGDDDPEYYEYQYTNKGFSGIIKIYGEQPLEYVYEKGIGVGLPDDE